MRRSSRIQVLDVEDEMLVAKLVEDYVTDTGHEITGLVVRSQLALEVAASGDQR